MPRTVWYPGHMAKGRRQLEALASAVDLLIEVRDARAPRLTSSPMLSLFKGKIETMAVLSKADLADEKITKEWAAYLKSGGLPADVPYHAVSSGRTREGSVLGGEYSWLVPADCPEDLHSSDYLKIQTLKLDAVPTILSKDAEGYATEVRVFLCGPCHVVRSRLQFEAVKGVGVHLMMRDGVRGLSYACGEGVEVCGLLQGHGAGAPSGALGAAVWAGGNACRSNGARVEAVKPASWFRRSTWA